MTFRHIIRGATLFLFTALLAQASPAQNTKPSGKEMQKRLVPDYSNTLRKDVPPEYTWNNADLFPSQEAFNREKEEVVKLIGTIEQKRNGWTNSARSIAEMYELTDNITMRGRRLNVYAQNLQDMELSNPMHRAMTGELQSIFNNYNVQLAFRNADLLTMDEALLRSYLTQDPRMSPYRFRIEEILRGRQHTLPEEQKRIVALSDLFAGASQDAAEMLNNVDIPAPEVRLSDGNAISLNYSNFIRYRSTKNAEDRKLIMKTFWTNRKRFENTLATLYNGGMKKDLFNARVEHYGSCLEARLFDDNIDTAVYHQLIRTITSHLEPLHRYYRLKKELLKRDTLRYDDNFASAVASVEREYSFDEARVLVTNALKPLGSDYGAVLAAAFSNRWIDRYANKDKQMGAFSRGVYDVHPYVKMNYDGSYDNVSTLAHELGHTLHSYLSARNQPFGLAGYTTFSAEIASTFNENLLISHMLKNEKDDLFKLFLLDKYLEQVRSTLFHQTMFAEFELAMHQRVEEGQSLTTDWLDKTYLAILRKYYVHDNGVMVVDDYFQNAWSSVPHFFYNFYVFQYSTGMIASIALSDEVLKGTPKAVDRYLTMLKSGGSDYPIALLKSAGVDMTSPAPTLAALKRFNDLVTEMETIVHRLNVQKKI